MKYARLLRPCTVLVLVSSVLITAAPQGLRGADTADDLVLDLRRNVVRVAAQWAGNMHDGFGLIVGERDDFLYIVTADHVVRGDGPDEFDSSPTITFFQDQGTEYEADLLGTRLPPRDGDVAVLRLRKVREVNWRRDAVAVSRVTRDLPVWFVGLQRDWFVPSRPGTVNRVEPVGKIISEALNVRVGTSGAPLISDEGIIGMIVVDSGAFAHATPIDLIQRAVQTWRYPWDLSPAPPPVHECDRLAAHPNDKERNSKVPGVPFTNIELAAVQRCREAILQYPQVARFEFQLGRASEAMKHYGEAIYWYRTAANRSYPQAQADLAQMYDTGTGVLKNDGEAARLYRLAADQGNAAAQVNLGVMYEQGRGGLAKDDVEAVRLYRRAAEQGDRRGQAYLAAMRQRGNSNPKLPKRGQRN